MEAHWLTGSPLFYKVAQLVCPGPLVRLQYNDWRVLQLRKNKVSCDAVWIWSLVPGNRAFLGDIWQVGVVSQRVYEQSVSEASFWFQHIFPFTT